ncbi:cellular retinoic acid-binding protein 2-like [Ylistrum balloti]|uniref:cellular retinoic acid-binding protein 2-like n=1 Tax=Ylistrum balloti TaxID=509963 RepID=UPI002905A879|nr:cellular retinoic acid-binding protein 2-like [Ylistrum balloti]
MASLSDTSADLEAIKRTFVGKWKLTKTEGQDEYLKLLGVNFMLRKVAAAAGSSGTTIDISVDGEQIRIVNTGPKKTTNKLFKLNIESEDTDPVDNAVTAITTFECGRLVTNSKPRDKSKAKETKVSREVTIGANGKEEMIMTVNAESVVMKRYFVR